jgi:hypothetical protein
VRGLDNEISGKRLPEFNFEFNVQVRSTIAPPFNSATNTHPQAYSSHLPPSLVSKSQTAHHVHRSWIRVSGVLNNVK